MRTKKPEPERPTHVRSEKPISLKELAKQLNLSPTSLSLVLNGSPAASSIPQPTQELIFAAAKKFNYRPNFLARSLRVQRTYAIGVLMPELSDGYSSLVLAGIEDFLSGVGYMYLATSHHHQERKIKQDASALLERGVEGLILVDTPMSLVPPWAKMVSVSGHERIPMTTNVVLNHDAAADLALGHLVALGHRHIAVIKGQSFSSDTEVRFQSILKAAARLGLSIPDSLVAQMEADSPSPVTGYDAARQLLARGAKFTALFSFNDISAIGAMRALRDAGLRAPQDVSVVGFDDVLGAAYHYPSLTTIRQPLQKMGRIAAETLLKGLGTNAQDAPEFIEVDPELVVRESTGPVPASHGMRQSP